MPVRAMNAIMLPYSGNLNADTTGLVKSRLDGLLNYDICQVWRDVFILRIGLKQCYLTYFAITTTSFSWRLLSDGQTSLTGINLERF